MESGVGTPVKSREAAAGGGSHGTGPIPRLPLFRRRQRLQTGSAIMKKLRIETRVLAGFTLALAVIAAGGALVYHAIGEFNATSKAAVTSREVLAELDGTYSSLTQAEAHERSFLVLGDSGDLAQRQAAIGRLDVHLAELHRLIGADPRQRSRLQRLTGEIASYLRLLRQSTPVRAHGQPVRRQRAATLPVPYRIRHLVELMRQTEATRLHLRRAHTAMRLHETIITLVLLLLASAASLSFLYIGIRHEIRDRRSAEDALLHETELLSQSKERMRAVLDTAAEAIIVIDGDGTVERFNASAERMFGWSSGEIVGQNVCQLLPVPRESGVRQIPTSPALVVGSGCETEGRRRGGETFPLEISVSKIRIAGKPVFTSVLRDISERRRSETALAAAMQELRNSNEELRNFAYVVSHDLKAPLRGIGSLADWLQADYAEQLGSEGRKYLQLLMGRVRRMDQLIDGILEYSRVGRVTEARTYIDLDQVVRESVDLLVPPAHIRIVIDGALPSVAGEPTRMRQLFQNLLSNAIKFMDKPHGLIRVSAHAADGVWHFTVADNGPGIDPRHHEKIFQLFQTLAPRDRIEGTGVGLALARKIVELHGGHIWVESTPGQGSKFHFTFPHDVPAEMPRTAQVP